MAANRRAPALITVGAIVLIGSVAGFVIVPEHAPATSTIDARAVSGCTPPARPGQPVVLLSDPSCHVVHTGLAHTPYDALRIATWALLIVGALTVGVGLIGYSRQEVRS